MESYTEFTKHLGKRQVNDAAGVPFVNSAGSHHESPELEMMHFDLDDTGTIIFGEYRYEAWPYFGNARSSDERDCSPGYLVNQILLVDDLFCWAWRSRIPTPVRKTILSYPDGHADLLVLAQAAPDAFLRMYNDNPALLRILVSRDGVRSRLRLTDPSRRASLLCKKHCDVLACLGWRRSRSLARLLKKVSEQECHLYRIRKLLTAADDPSVARILRHLPAINGEVIRLLDMPDVCRDYQMLLLAATEPKRANYAVSEMASTVRSARRDLGQHPWPFSGAIRSWEGLIRLVSRSELARHGASGPFPEPPIPEVRVAVPGGLQIVALNSVSRLHEEGKEMRNCVFGYIESVFFGDSYAYRLTSPERATVLLSHNGRGKWEVDQAMLPGNERDVSEQTRKLLQVWINIPNVSMLQ